MVPNNLVHHKATGDVFQFLGDIFAQLREITAALRAILTNRQNLFNAVQMVWQGFAFGPSLWAFGINWLGFHNLGRRFCNLFILGK